MPEQRSKTLIFPLHLMSPTYANRKFTINVLEMGTFGEGVQSAMDAALERINDLTGSGESESESSGDDIIANLEANYDKEVAAGTIFTIVLPLPNTFTDSQSHSWNTEKGLMGAAAEAAEGAGLAGLIPGADAIGQRLGGLGSVLPGAISQGASAVANYNIGTALGNLSNSTGIRKPLVDPGYFQNYTGSEPREFQFSFDLIPRNQFEARTMVEIILKLKEYSSPEMARGGVSLLAPHFFDIDVSNRYISGMANLRGVVLKSMNIDYGADGYMQQYADGTPKYIKLDLTFAERKMMTAQHFRKNLYA